MPRKKDKKREQAKQIFLDSNGMIKNTEIAQILEVDSAKISKWKCLDKWKEALENEPKKRGAPFHNQNAKGHGAPLRNRNAQTHGAYSTIYFDELTAEEKKLVKSITLDAKENMLRELQTLIVKENDLKKRIAELHRDDTGELYLDRVVEVHTLNKGDSASLLGVATRTTTKSSAFERAMKLETELSKIHGRIIKLLDSAKSYELEQKRISLEEKRYALMKQKTSGVYEIDPDTGEIEDDYLEET